MQNDCKQNANKSANIAQYMLALGELTKERTHMCKIIDK